MSTTQRQELLHELAYASIQASELWNELESNAECDAMADELAAAIQRTIDNWIAHRVKDKVEGERLDALPELTKTVVSSNGPDTVFPLRHPALRSLTEAQENQQ